jgi:hypothetical protein
MDVSMALKIRSDEGSKGLYGTVARSFEYCGCWRKLAKQKPLSFKPTMSGSSTAGAQGSWRDQMPKWAIKISPDLMLLSAV